MAQGQGSPTASGAVDYPGQEEYRGKQEDSDRDVLRMLFFF